MPTPQCRRRRPTNRKASSPTISSVSYASSTYGANATLRRIRPTAVPPSTRARWPTLASSASESLSAPKRYQRSLSSNQSPPRRPSASPNQTSTDSIARRTRRSTPRTCRQKSPASASRPVSPLHTASPSTPRYRRRRRARPRARRTPPRSPPPPPAPRLERTTRSNQTSRTPSPRLPHRSRRLHHRALRSRRAFSPPTFASSTFPRRRSPRLLPSASSLSPRRRAVRAHLSPRSSLASIAHHSRAFARLVPSPASRRVESIK